MCVVRTYAFGLAVRNGCELDLSPKLQARGTVPCFCVKYIISNTLIVK